MGYQKNKSVIQKYLLSLVKRGQLGKNEKLIFHLLRRIKQEEKVNSPLSVLEKSLENVKPLVGFSNRRLGARRIAIPIALQKGKEEGIGIRWIIESAGELKGVNLKESLYNEISNAYHNEGRAIAKRKVRHQLAQENRAYLKYL